MAAHDRKTVFMLAFNFTAALVSDRFAFTPPRELQYREGMAVLSASAFAHIICAPVPGFQKLGGL